MMKRVVVWETDAMRQKYFVIASVVYIILGLVIVVRSALAHALVLAILGLVFIALGAVRLRDYHLRGKARSGT
jgi:uncharacterized membrane protein HdeD (DUF308 family)